MIILAVPLAAVGIATAGQAASQVQVASRAHHLQRLVADVAIVDEVRRGVEAEIVPSLAALLSATPPGTAREHREQTPPSVRGGVAELDAARAAADAAFAASARSISDQPTAVRLRAARRQLATVRSRVGGATPKYDQWWALLGNLNDIEHSLLHQADATGLGDSTTQALNDVATVAAADQFGGQLVPALMSTLFHGSPTADAAVRGKFVTVWGSYQTASAQAAHDTAAPLRTAWAAAAHTQGARTVDRIMLGVVTDPQHVDWAELPNAGRFALARQLQFNSILATSLTRARDFASKQHRLAARNLLLIVSLDLLLLLVTLVLVLLVRLWVSRSLSKLAGQATQLSEGQLPDVEISGPREVRTVARALTEAVHTLRGIQAQAAAAAAGTLDPEALETALPGPLGHVVHASVVRIFDAMKDQEDARRELAHQAAHDPLTDLPNRGFAVNLINRSLHRAQRTGAMTGLMFIDLDHFKAVNDTFGHAAGDYVLQVVASRMIDVVRDGDMVARLGGDEFVVLLEDVTSESDFVQLADRLLAVLAEPIPFAARDLKVGACIGVAICRDAHVDGDRLMQEADAAAYRAKSGGRGRVDIFDDGLRRELAEHAELEAALYTALANEEFVLYYQPVVDLATGAAVGLEALIRWDRPGIGLVPPMDFIPVAESSELINDIGRYVLREATRQLAEWTARDPAAAQLTMSVNISGRHLSSPQLIVDVTEALENSGIGVDRLIVELTETMLVDDPRSTANMTTLQRLGVRVALDDFGTGYTSIGQLSKLPIDTLKIDRSFVSSSDPSRQELCKLMVAAARAFGLTVVAEGVETDAQADLLRQIHVENCQGFLYARPQPGAALDPGSLVQGQLSPDGSLGQLAIPASG